MVIIGGSDGGRRIDARARLDLLCSFLVYICARALFARTSWPGDLFVGTSVYLFVHL